MEKLKVIELFGGIGACSKALDRLKIDYEIADYVEIDKYAVASFNAIHNTNFEPQDIRTYDKDIKADLIMHGSPCQDFSVAGKQAGGDEGSGTRSSLMYETLRIVEKVRPKYVIWENVKNLLSKKHRHNFDAYLEHMESLGYQNYYQVLNAKDYGVPQNRERVFTISILGGGEFEFPEKQPLEKRLKDILEENVDEKYYLSDKTIASYVAHTERHQALGHGFKFEPTDGDTYAHTISTRAGQRQTDNFIKDTIHCVDIPQTVTVRKHEVDIEGLRTTLREHKCYTNKELATLLGLPLTNVEHWFRNDNSFSIPDAEVWPKLKELLKIKTNKFDKSIMEFEEREGVYDKSNRCYLDSGIAPTLTNASADEKIIVKGNLDIKGQDQIKRVYDAKGISPTLSTMQGGNRQPKIVEEPFVVASRGREPQALHAVRNEYGKAIRKEYEAGEIEAKRSTIQQLEPRTDGVTNTLTTVQKDNYICEPMTTRGDNIASTIRASIYKQGARNLMENIKNGLGYEGVIEPLKIKTANIKGYDEAVDGDGVDLAYPDSQTRRGRVGHGVSKTIMTGESMGVVENYRIRKLTPKECWRLMGFDDVDFEKAAKANSNTQLYKQAGNSIVVNVLEAIFRNLLLKEQVEIKPIEGGKDLTPKEEHNAISSVHPDVAVAMSAFAQAKKGAEEVGCELVGDFEYRGKEITIRLKVS